MKYSLRFVTILGLAAGIAAARQDAPPAPPAPPAEAAMPAPAAAPAPRALLAAPAPPTPFAAPTPMPARAIFLEQDQDAREISRQVAEQARELAQQARDQSREMQQEMQQEIREQARKAAEDARINLHVPVPAIGNFNFDFAAQGRGAAPIAMRYRNDNSLYGRGQSALDDHKYDQALDYFSEVVSRGGPNVDGALYWKAYTLNKLGRRDEAVATLAQLRTSFPASHWLEDAKALDLEVKQAAGKPVSPESESDDDLKLMALNGLAQTDPARAFPLLDKLLKGPASPKLKKKAVYVLAVNTSPQAQQLLEQIARGNSNPDLQLTAVQYMLGNKQFPNRTQVLYEIYNSTSDPSVKREIISALRSNNDTDHLVQIYKAEKDSSLRRDAISGIGEVPGNAALWQLFQSETTVDGKLQILDAMYRGGNTEKLTEVARTDKDPKVRMRAIQVLASQKPANLGDAMTNLYGSEQDAQVKRQIVNEIANRRDAKALVDLFHKESNFEMKKTILNHLQNMHTAEANELYMEILSK